MYSLLHFLSLIQFIIKIFDFHFDFWNHKIFFQLQFKINQRFLIIFNNNLLNYQYDHLIVVFLFINYQFPYLIYDFYFIQFQIFIFPILKPKFYFKIFLYFVLIPYLILRFKFLIFLYLLINFHFNFLIKNFLFQFLKIILFSYWFHFLMIK